MFNLNLIILLTSSQQRHSGSAIPKDSVFEIRVVLRFPQVSFICPLVLNTKHPTVSGAVTTSARVMLLFHSDIKKLATNVPPFLFGFVYTLSVFVEEVLTVIV